MQTVINWRPYPEQQPPQGGRYLVMTSQGITGRKFYHFSKLWVTFQGSPVVTHFALPEDITTTEAP